VNREGYHGGGATWRVRLWSQRGKKTSPNTLIAAMPNMKDRTAARRRGAHPAIGRAMCQEKASARRKVEPPKAGSDQSKNSATPTNVSWWWPATGKIQKKAPYAKKKELDPRVWKDKIFIRVKEPHPCDS